MNLKNCEAYALIQNSKNETQSGNQNQKRASNSPFASLINTGLRPRDNDRLNPETVSTVSLSEKLLRLLALTLALLCLAATNARACGPWFPNNLLDSGDQAVLVSPTLRFGDELERMQLIQTRWRAVITTNAYPQEALEAELADLTAALKKAKTSPEEIERIRDAHRGEREKLQGFVNDHERWQSSGGWDWHGQGQQREPVGTAPKFPGIKFAPGLPEEFVDYFDGACAWRRPDARDEGKARAAWERLLARPAAERKYKSTWAAFMLGKLWTDEDPEKAMGYFQQVRELAKRGFADSIGLATASLGLEARVNLDEHHFEKAIELYLEQLAAGDGSGIQSLNITAANALNNDGPGGEELLALAKNPRTQRVLTAYLIAEGPVPVHEPTSESPADSITLRWLKAVEAAGVKDVESAEKLALAAYQDGSFAEAQRWIKRAPGSPLTQWLQAKLLLRDGKVAQAAALLAKVSNSFPLESIGTNAPETLLDNLYVVFADSFREPHGVGAQVLGELGVLRLARRQYTESLDALLRSGFWQDAAYVAERVLTLDELKSYVDRNWPATMVETNSSPTNDVAADDSSEWVTLHRPAENIRYLLARRLTRSQRGFLAREYYPEQWRESFDELALGLSDGWNEALPAEHRAKALFSAAVVTRANGMELVGTEVGPDWFVHGGNFECGVTAEGRTNGSFSILPAGSDELRRAFAHEADPAARFHYRYQAAFLAWEAAKLMPNNSVETARALCTAGSWIKNRDPQTADLFYKSLVRRCRKTDIGVEADRIRWFPELDVNGDVIPRDGNISAPPEESTAPPPEFEPEVEPGVEEAEMAEESETSDADALPAAEKGYEYIVHAGDSILAIAHAYYAQGVNVTVRQIFDANPGLDPERLRIGQKIFIPAAER